MYAQSRAADPPKGYLALILELLKHAQAHVLNRKQGVSESKVVSEEAEEVTGGVNIEIDISLKNDDRLQSIIEVISQVQRRLVRLGEEPVRTLIGAIEGMIVGYL
jgi:hypothetical protein